MTAITTQDERPTPDATDDVRGHAGPLGVVIGVFVVALSAELAIGIGFTGPEVQGTLKGIKPRERLLGGGGKPPR